MEYNICTNTDSYKLSQYNQYPPKTEYVYSYIESRGGMYDKLVFMGTQMLIQEYVMKRVTLKMINRAEKIANAHGEPFNRAGWLYILNELDGVLPVEIYALDEGTVIGTQHILAWIKNTDPKCWWLTSYLETLLLRGIWYPTTVASNSYYSKQIILKGLKDTGDESLIDFKLHDFGARGVSSFESAGIGGLAHIAVFMGTDTLTAIDYAIEYYDADSAPAFSVPAMEHSTVTSWTRDGEVDSYRNMIRTYGAPGKIVSIVSDSYDIFNAIKLFGTELKQDIIDTGCYLVVRPDSGDPATIVTKVLQLLDLYFGSTANEKGYKVINHNVRVLQGDGINHQSIRSILFSAQLAGFSADNITFGQGGALLQIVNRDDLKFAMKCSAAFIDGEWVEVYKDPITDQGKKSKRGRLDLVKIGGVYHTVRHEDLEFQNAIAAETGEFIVPSELKLRYRNGEMFNRTNLEEIRYRVKSG